MLSVDSILSKIAETGKKQIILQAPDGLIRTAVKIIPDLINAGYTVTLSGDPCYGACDLVQHLDADTVLVHLGHAPVEERKNVIYELYQQDFNPEQIQLVLPHLTEKRIGLVTTVQHVHMLPAIQETLKTKGYETVLGEPTKRTPYAGQVLGCSFGGARTDACEILYIGTGVFHALGVHLATGARVIAFDPYMRSCEEVTVRAFLTKRFSLIERAKEADIYGIIVSTKSGQQRMELGEQLTELHTNTILLSMKEVTPDQLLNIGLPCYVNTACPRLAYDDQPRFHGPVLSPQEFQIMCGVRTWDEYAIDEIL